MPIMSAISNRLVAAYRGRVSNQVAPPFQHRSDKLRQLVCGIGLSLATHIPFALAPVLSPSQTKPAPEIVAKMSIEQALEAMDKPLIEPNQLSEPEKRESRAKLKEYITSARTSMEKFKQDKGLAIDFSEILIPIEYYWQRTEDNVYLMPKDSLVELLWLFRDDLSKTGQLTKSNADRARIFIKLRELISSKSVYDPDAHFLPSLLVPEGGQSCQARTQYFLVLASHFTGKLLTENEQFVVTKFGDHDSQGIYNSKKQTLWLLDANEETDYLALGPQTTWTADLYHPAVLLQRAIDLYDQQEGVYDRFLIARANTPGHHAKVEIKRAVKGTPPLLSISPPVGSGNTFASRDTVLERSKATEAISSLRKVRALTRGHLTEIELISDKEASSLIEQSRVLQFLQNRFGLTKEELKERTQVDEHGIITELNFDYLDLNDPDLMQLKDSPNLQRLVLDGIQISDAGLAHLKGLSNLRKLVLNNTRITDAGLAQLRYLSNLRELYINGPITDAGLAQLKYFHNLQILYLPGTRITNAGLAQLKYLSNLHELNLYQTNISDGGLAQLKDLPNLRKLYLAGTRITDAGLAQLKYFPNLRDLNLYQTNISDAGLAQLKGLPNLLTLALSNTYITDAGLAQLKGLTKLQILGLRNTRITDAGLIHLDAMQNLREVYLQGTKVSENKIKELESKGIIVHR